MSFHYGKRKATVDTRDARLGDFLPSLAKAGLLPTPPSVFGHGNDFAGENWLMLGNGPDSTVFEGFEGCGCCAWSGPGHETMELCRNAGRPVPKFTGAVIVDQYSEYCGYNAKTGENDNGSDIREVLQWRQTKGLRDASGGVHKIGPYLSLEAKNLDELFYGAYLLESVGVGIEVPEGAQQEFSEHKPWTPGGPIVGGHYIPGVGRARAGYWTFITWAQRAEATDSFYSTLNDETWAYVSSETFRNVTGKDYEGFDEAQLEEYLHLVARAKIVGS